nr:hypothetical protein [Bacillota bacterium]
MKLLFVCNNLHIGGIQKALVNLLKEIADAYDVTLFLFCPCGDLMESVPQNVRIITGNRLTRIMGMSQIEAKRMGTACSLWRAVWTVLTRIFGIRFSFGVLTRLQKIHESYDIAISFSQNSGFKMFYGGCNEFVINSVNAKKKITFVHCDFRHYFGNNRYNR